MKQDLKKAGTPLPINDVWIAAHTLETGSTLVTDDNHLKKLRASVGGIKPEASFESAIR